MSSEMLFKDDSTGEIIHPGENYFEMTHEEPMPGAYMGYNRHHNFHFKSLVTVIGLIANTPWERFSVTRKTMPSYDYASVTNGVINEAAMTSEE